MCMYVACMHACVGGSKGVGVGEGGSRMAGVWKGERARVQEGEG